MEFAAAALSAVGSAVTSAVGGTTAAAGAAATGAASSGIGIGSVLSTILQGGATVAGVIGALNAGDARAGAYEAQARDAVTEQGIEALSGTERRDGLRRALLERLGQQDVQAAASGIDGGFGTAALARDEAQRDGERALTGDAETESFRVARLGERASELRRAAQSSRKAGLIQAAGIGIGGLASIGRRG